jgi:predicted nucleic acid-binding protein
VVGGSDLIIRYAHDLIIAAHALQTDRIILTFDADARFGDLPGVSATAL